MVRFSSVYAHCLYNRLLNHCFFILCVFCSGDMFCSSCTCKYHVPLVYEQKGKKGPTRVCIKCRDSCLAQKEKEKMGVQQANTPSKHAVLSSKDLSAPTGTSAVRPSQFVG